MNITQQYSIPLSIQWIGKPQCRVGLNRIPYILHFYNNSIEFINIYDGSIWKKLETDEEVVNAIDCQFEHYGLCVCALLRNSCVIWNGSGDEFHIALPCRMENVYALENGILFERVGDLNSMNMSFSLTSPTQSVPQYYSLSSPLSIPKPFSVYQTGDESFNISTISYLNVSLSLSVIDLYNTQADLNYERETHLIRVIPQYQLILFYNRSEKKHSLSRYSKIGRSVNDVMQEALKQPNFSLNDSYFNSLSNPDYHLSSIFTGNEMEEEYTHVECIPSMDDKLLFFYFSTQSFVDCACCSIADINTCESLSLEWLQRYEGRSAGVFKEQSFFHHCILLVNESEWSLLFEGKLLFSQPVSVKVGQEAIVHDGVLYCFPDFSQSIGYHIHFELGELEDQFISILAGYLLSDSMVSFLQKAFHQKQFELPVLCSLVENSSICSHALCLLLDHYWVVGDRSVQTIVQLIPHQTFLLDCYRQKIQPIWYSQVMLQYKKQEWLPLPFLLYYFFTFHTLQPFQWNIDDFAHVKHIIPYPHHLLQFLISASYTPIPPTSPLSTFYLLQRQESHKIQKYESSSPPSILKKVRSLLQSKSINLHIPSDETNIDVSKMIQVHVETQLLSITGYSLFAFPLEKKSQLHRNAFIQYLHDQSFPLNTTGRKNNECDLLDCDFPRSMLFFPHIHYTIHKEIESIKGYEEVSFTIDDLTFVLEDKIPEEQIGLLIALGHTRILRKIPLSLLKLKLCINRISKLKEDNPTKINERLCNYHVEAGYIFAIALAYHQSNDSQVIQLLQHYIHSLLSISNDNSLLYRDWIGAYKQDIIQLLWFCIVGIGLVCHNTQNDTILKYLISLQDQWLADKSINLIRYFFFVAVAIGLVSPSKATVIHQILINHMNQLQLRLTDKREARYSDVMCLGVQCPIEEIPGILLQIGFISFSFDQLSTTILHPIFGDNSEEHHLHFIQTNRSDVCFFYGVALALSQFSALSFSLQSILQLIPPKYASILCLLPIAVTTESHNEEYQNLLCFVGGLLFIASIKFSNQTDPSAIQPILQHIQNEECMLSSNATIADFVLSFVYHLIYFQRLPYLHVYPRLFVRSLLQSLGILFQGTGNETVLILLRHLVITATEKKMNNSYEEESWNDLIEVCSISIGLVALGQASATLKTSASNMVFLVTSLLPAISPLFEDYELLPSMCRLLLYCCEVEKKESEEEIERTCNGDFLPYMQGTDMKLLEQYYKNTPLDSFLSVPSSVNYQHQCELVSLWHKTISHSYVCLTSL